jgi:membrane fusion protein (multidrug efflux system)
MSAPDGGGRRRALIALAAVLILAGGGWWVWYRLVGRYYVTTEDAYVHGDRIPIASQRSGTVVALDAHDTETVARGAVLLRLDETRARLALAAADARLDEAVRRVRVWRALVREDKASLEAALSRARLARDNARRARALLKARVVTRQREETLQSLAVVATRRVALAREQLAAALVRAGRGPLAEQPLVRSATAAVEQAWVERDRCVVRAPVAGTVIDRRVELGSRVRPGETLMMLVPLADLWVDANFKETELRSLRIGQPVRMTAAAYGSSVVYRGRILGFSPGTGEAFSLIPPENATGNWIRIVQRLPVRIGFAPQTLARHPLRLGLSMNVVVDTRPGAPGPKTLLPVHPLRATDVYAGEWRKARAYAARLLVADGAGASVPLSKR